MAINLLNIQPHKVSTDLSGYITYIYGPPKVGKTTFATQMPSALLLAFEKGYNALPGVMAQDINTWGEMRQVYRELKKPEVQAIYKTIVVDTADVAADLCQKYICNQLGIDNMGDGGWSTNSWSKYKKEFEEVFRGLTMMGYAVVFISHDKSTTEKDQNGKEYTSIKPAVQSSALNILEGMADLYGYARGVSREDGSTRMVLTLRSPAGSGIACGCRFKYIEPEIDFSYESLAKALTAAIEKEGQVHGKEYVTSEREVVTAAKEYDFDELMSKFEHLVGDLMVKDQDYYAPRITQIIERYFGKGKKMSAATRDQAELVYLVVNEIEEDLVKSKK